MKHVYLCIITVLVSWCCVENIQAQSTTTICTGGTAVLTATLSGGTDCTVLWEQSSSATGPWTATTLTESPTNVFTTPPLTVTTYYRAQYFCTGNGCDDPYASPVTEVIVVPDPVITVTSPLTVCSLTDLTVTTSGGAGTCTIQWQSSTTGTSGWTDISGANASTYNAPAEDIVMYYRATYTCVGSSNCNPATSATVTVNPRPVVSNQTATICSDVVTGVTLNNASNSVPISGYDITFINANGLTASAGSPVTGTNFTNAEISNDAWTNTTGAPVNVIYTIVPVSDASCTGDPFTVTVTVNPEPVGVATPATQTVCSDVAITTIALTTSNSLAGTTFSWTRDNTANITNLANSGTTDISGTPNNVTGTSQTTTYTITPTSTDGCVGNDFTATVTVNPEPVGVATPATQTVCSDVAITTIALTTSNSLAGTTFSWTRDNTANITNLANSGTTDISGTPNNVTGTSQTTTYTITPTNGGCVGDDFTATVTVNPEPVGVATPATQTVCSDVAITTIALSTSNSLAGTTFSWTRDNTANITNLANSGTTDISGTPNNVTGTSQTTTYTITPTNGGCVGDDFTATVTVNPEPVGVATPATQTVCSDVAITTIALSTSNSLAGTTFSWTRDNTANITNLANSGTTDISGTPNNVTGTSQTTTYTITPTSTDGCVGNDFTATVTVNPEPVGVATPATQTVCSDVAITTIALTTSNSLAGTTFSWTRDNTANITNLANSGTTDISGTPNNVTGTSQTTTYTITPTNGGCVGDDFTATVTVNPEPVGVATPATQTVCSDVAITTIALTTSNSLAGTTFSWTRDNTANITNLANSGTTDISGTPNNVTGTSQTTTYTITPTSTDGCVGNDFTATVTVNPEPVGVATPATQTVCSDVAITTIALTTSNSLAGTTFSWTRDNTANITNLANSGTTDISGTPNNVTGTSQTTTYTITPTSTDGCVGNDFTATVTVNPEPVGVATPATQTVCSDVAITTIALTTSNSLAGTTFSWTRDNTANITNLANSGTTDISGTPNNVTGTSQTTTYTITPTNGGCVGDDFTATVTVNPEPVGVATPATQTVCSDVAITTIALTTSNSLAGTTFSWTRDNTANITNLANSGTTDISGTPNNVTGTSQTTTYTITPTSTDGCVGNDFTATVTVNPEPVGVATPATQTVCSDVAITTIALTTSNSLAGTTFSWTRDNTANITNLANSGTTDISGTPNNVTGTSQTTTYTITPTSTDGCVGNDFTATVTVNPEPVGVATPATQTVCSDVAITTIALTTSNSLAGTTFSWTRDNTANITNLANSGTTDISGTPNNVTGTSQTTTYTITPTNGGCVGDDFTATVTVNPEPVGVATPATQTVCSDVAITTIALSTSNSLAGTTFSWTRDNTANITNLANSGTTDISGTPNNVTGTSQTTTYTITPTNGGCVGNDFTATVTVNPEPVGVATPATQTVCSDVAITTIALSTSNSLAGTTFSWTRDNTANITNLANSGTTDISGTPNNVTGTSQTTTYTITPTSTDGCVGNDFTATVTVNPEPVGVATPATQTVCSDVAITTIALTTSNSLAGTTFSWTRDNTANITNLANSGTTDISGTPNNVTGTSQTTTYTITPTNGGCVGDDFTATVTVNPEPVGVATPATQTVCSDVAITTIALSTSNSLAGTTFSWTRDNTANITNLANSGTTDISGTPNNVTGTSQTTTYTITPTNGGCVGDDFTATVTVNPEPVGVATPATQTVCSDVAITTIALSTSNSLAGTTFSWTRDNTANITNLANSGTTDISGTPNNVTGTSQTTTYTITPTNGGCVGDDFTATVTVNPEPVGVATPATQTVCSDVAITTIALSTSNSLAGTTFSWTRDNTANITNLANSGTTDISGTPNNVTGTSQTTTYTITPTNGGCVGDDFTATVTVNPEPVGVDEAVTVCENVLNIPLADNITNLSTGVTFSWVATDNPDVAGESTTPQTGGIINDVLDNTSTTPQVVNYTVTPTSADGCVGNPFLVTVTVNPDPQITIAPTNTSICTGGTNTLTATISGGDSCTIQWQSSPDGAAWTDISGANGTTYTTPALTVTTYYRAIYSCTTYGCDTATSNTATVIVTAQPTIIINVQPGN